MALAHTLLSLRRRLLAWVAKLAFLAPLLIRVTLAAVFIESGYGKLANLGQVTEFFASLGIPMPAFNAALAATTEFAGGILLLVGLAARLAALPMAFTMLIAILTAKRSEIEGITSLLGFDEWSYLVMFLVIALIGAGPLSLDALIARRLDRNENPRHLGTAPDPVLAPEARAAQS
jgi:putative oxidoreductase